MSATDLVRQSAAPMEFSDIWQDAVLRYEARTGVSLTSMTTASNLDGLLSSIFENMAAFEKKRHDGSRLQRLRSCLKSSLKSIHLLGQIVAHATKAVFPPSEAISGAVHYLFEIANTVSTNLDRVSDLFEDLSTYLSQLQVLENSVPPSPVLHKVLVDILTSVLDLCGLTANYIQTKRSTLVLRSIVLKPDQALKEAFDRFHMLVDRERGIVRNLILMGVEHLRINDLELKSHVTTTMNLVQGAAAHVELVGATMNRAQRVVEEQSTDMEREAVLNWLSSLNFHETQRKKFEEHQKGTGQWFLESPEFQQWFLGKADMILWCSGSPGAGKSVLMSLAVDYVQEHSLRGKVAVSYVFCDYQQPRTQHDTDILSSINRQLAEHLPTLPETVKAFRDRFIEKSRNPTLEEQATLAKTIATLFDKVFIFIDALDECSEKDRSRVLLAVKKLASFCRIYLTSRPHLRLDDELSLQAHVHIEAQEEDIETYVRSELQIHDRLRRLVKNDPKLEKEVISRVKQKAAGMFLLAHLQVTHLCGLASKSQIRRAITSSPQKLTDFYHSTIQRIDDQGAEDARLIRTALAFLHHARRPLTMLELQHALATDDALEEITPDDLPFSSILITISLGLMRLSDATGKVELVHHTFGEYLDANPSILLQNPEMKFAVTCLTYLCMSCFSDGPCLTADAVEDRLDNFSFYEYSSKHWGDHAAMCSFPLISSFAANLLGDERKKTAFVQILYMPSRKTRGWHCRYPDQFGTLHIAAYFGLVDLLLLELRESVDIDCRDSLGATPLLLASQSGHVAAATLMIEKGANIDAKNLMGESSLHWAARNGHLDVAQALLEAGANLHTKDYDDWTPLDWAIINGHDEIVKMLLCEDSIISKPEMMGKALHLASEAGNNEAVSLLHTSGAETDWKDDQGSTALTWAVADGHRETTLLLLGKGADVNCLDKYLNSPLHWAISHPHIIRDLLHYGARVNSQNNEGQTPLLWAVQDGMVSGVEALVQTDGVNLNIQDRHGFTPLHAAALKGYESMVALLLGNGADPNIIDENGWSPLHAAALRRHTSIIEVLASHTTKSEEILLSMSEHCADVNIKAFLEHQAEQKSMGSQAVTGLRWAAGDGRIEKIRVLLDNGALIDAHDIGGWTALTIGAWMNKLAAVQFLIECGANVNQCERGGRSGLLIASEDGYADLVKLLVESGADVNAQVHRFTPMLLAARNEYFHIVDYLVDQNANVNVHDYDGQSPLHWAAIRGKTETARRLLEHGANVNAQDLYGRTSLMWAAGRGSAKFMKLLLQWGADPHVRSQDGSTALHGAAYSGCKAAVTSLLQTEADVNSQSVSGFTALHVSTIMGFTTITRLLLSRGANPELKINQIPTDARSQTWGSLKRGEDNSIIMQSFEKLVSRVLIVEGFGDQEEDGSVVIRPGLTAKDIARKSGNQEMRGFFQ